MTLVAYRHISKIPKKSQTWNPDERTKLAIRYLEQCWICNKCYKNSGSDRLLPSSCYDLLWFSLFIIPTPRPPPLRSLSKGQLRRYVLTASSNFWVCGLNTMVQLFKWNHFNSTFSWYHIFLVLGFYQTKFNFFLHLWFWRLATAMYLHRIKTGKPRPENNVLHTLDS